MTFHTNGETQRSGNMKHEERKQHQIHDADTFLEYRRKQGLYEVNTPGVDNGLLVYRINTCCGGNADGPPDEVYIYRPGGDADTAFPAHMFEQSP